MIYLTIPEAIGGYIFLEIGLSPKGQGAKSPLGEGISRLVRLSEGRIRMLKIANRRVHLITYTSLLTFGKL